MKIKICHITSVHTRYDTRIFVKMCNSLAKNNNYKVYLIVADGNGNETIDGVDIVDVGANTGGRIHRITTIVKKTYKIAKELNCRIYHLHDPELIPIGLKLKKLNKKVIFDVHENIAKQIKSKEHIIKFLRYLISFVYRVYEKWALNKFDGLILAENSYTKEYGKFSNNVEIVLNMPDISLLSKFYSVNRIKNEMFYLGGISVNRGVDVIIETINILKNKIPDIFMHYIGPFEKDFLDRFNLDKIKNNIKFYGAMPLVEGLEFSLNAKVGLSILKPIDNYLTSYSTKIFEYMAMGLPVITSDFKLYKDVIEINNCGLCVDPSKPKEVANAIEYIMINPKIAKQMGENGRKIVEEKYNWEVEKKKMLEFYKKLNGEV
ncbi:MAG: glycosyltransferase [Candidatus Cloacimonetes bacterium]|jgi:glycosyltransferase involved in cell wall biosynthesis|nr:glycosyltransferase [Candidatus Cloacimonadota bacterium]